MRTNKEPYEVSRVREILPKLIMIGGPLGGFTPFMRRRLKEYRKAHPDFDKYLSAIKKFLIKEKHRDYKTLIEFLDNNSNGFTIHASDSIFAMMNKLYNLCLSPNQTVDYINKCYDVCQSMLNSNYCLYSTYEVSICLDSVYGKAHKYVTLHVVTDKEQSVLCKYDYYFKVTLNPLQAHSFLGGNKVELETKLDIYHDALSLFENAQNEYLKRKIVQLALAESINRKIFTLSNENRDKCTSDFVQCYNVIDEPGGYYSINKHMNDGRTTKK